MRPSYLPVLALLVAACGDNVSADFHPEAVAGVEDYRLKVVLQEQWELARPEPDTPPLKFPERHQRRLGMLDAMYAIDPAGLSSSDRLTWEVFVQIYGSFVEVAHCIEGVGDLAAPDQPPAARRHARKAMGDTTTVTPECYRTWIRYHTTLDLAPEELHQLGLEQLAEVEAEIAAVGTRLYGVATLPEIRARLESDPAQRFASIEELMTVAQAEVDRATEATRPLFGALPERPLKLIIGDVQASYLLPWNPTAPAEYEVAAQPIEAQLRWQLEAVTIHEGIPGHHLERARIFERLDLPWIRRSANHTAYVEGWAFYTEYLADEIGFYSDDAARLGALSNRALRACRLVVDTGLHALGWDRDRALAFLAEHTLEPLTYVEFQVDRYLGEPGQALAYQVGADEIRRLRAQAEAALGDDFSLLDFHEHVLADGSLPLGLLTARVEAWIDGARRMR